MNTRALASSCTHVPCYAHGFHDMRLFLRQLILHLSRVLHNSVWATVICHRCCDLGEVTNTGGPRCVEGRPSEPWMWTESFVLPEACQA